MNDDKKDQILSLLTLAGLGLITGFFIAAGITLFNGLALIFQR